MKHRNKAQTSSFTHSARVILITLTIMLSAASAMASEWSSYGAAPGGGQYSDLKQINRDTIGDLEQVWEYHTGDVSYGTADEEADATTFEVTPILANDMLYLCSAFGRVIALNPGSGEEIWAFDPGVKRTGTVLGAHICRSVSYWESENPGAPGACNKRVFVGTVDGRVVAVDADTGQACREFGAQGAVHLGDFDHVNKGFVGITSAPVIFRDKVIVGSAISSYTKNVMPNGTVRALDARSGRQIWEWNPLPEEMRKILGGVNVWPPMSVDEQRGLVFLPTGSATVDPYGAHRKDPIPYANAVVALKADTGEPVWHYQIVHHDLWDYDLPSQPIAVDIRKDGKTIPVIIQMNKMGLTFVFHRETGEPVFPIEERPVPQSDIPGEHSSPTQPFPTAFEPLALTELKAEDAWGVTFWDQGACEDKIASYRNDGLFTPPSVQGSIALPNGYGGVNWGNAAYDPVNNLLIVNTTNIASSSHLLPRDEGGEVSLTDHANFVAGGPLEGTPYIYRQTPIMSPLGAPCSPPPWGTMTALDMGTGKTVWKIPFGAVPVPWASWFSTLERWGSPLIGGPMATAGGLVFAGASLDATIRAVDIATGEIVWDEDLPAPGNATPMTYEYQGKQYVVIAAGGNAVAGTKLGDSVVAFALDD